MTDGRHHLRQPTEGPLASPNACGENPCLCHHQRKDPLPRPPPTEGPSPFPLPTEGPLASASDNGRPPHLSHHQRKDPLSLPPPTEGPSQAVGKAKGLPL